jgi:hypothetical protein
MVNAIFVRQEAVLRMALDTAVKVEGRTSGLRRRRGLRSESSRHDEPLPLTPALREFIDRVIVPILVEHYIEEQNITDDLVGGSASVGESHGKPAEWERRRL